ncbi:histidine phosphatase family protein [Pseudoruegeria sp. HB172150]|uniref:histidine phosphatase family protein n=1 Tax=Pseudoruegeria sp. HB172150 TaxID=2721164 RepID=UPI001554EB9A|nr:histidine phosphatase family protein [Pseudoruegeria sp. HB172150]
MIDRRRFLTLCAAFAALPVRADAPVAMPPGTTLIILRHADRTGDHLNARGQARAEALVAALDAIPIDAIYAPGIRRNLDTAAPLAAARNLTVQRIPGERPAPVLMSAGAGRAIVWVGNKGNLASIWQDLGAPDPAPLDYGDLFIVTRAPDGTPVVARHHFGP